MKICHVITRFIVGGAQENTLASIRGQLAAGHDVTLVTGPSKGREGNMREYLSDEATHPSFHFIEIPFLIRPVHPWYDIRAYCWLRRHFLAQQYDVIHTHSSKAGVIGRAAAASARSRHGTCVIHTIHGLACDAYHPWWRTMLYRMAERICASKADCLISVCDAMTQHALEAGIGHPAQFRTIYSACDIDAFRKAASQREELRAAQGVSSDTCVIVAVTRLFPMKGVEDFLQVLSHLARHVDAPVKSFLVGDGPLRASIEQQRVTHLPADMLTCVGRVPPCDVPAWMGMADIVVHLSYREGLARVVVQGIACGVPVVCYDIGGAREIVSDGLNGYVCVPGEVEAVCAHIAELVTNTEQRRCLADAAGATDIDHFSFASMTAALEDVYNQMCDKRPKGTHQ